MPTPKPRPAALKLIEGRSPGRDSGGRVVKEAPPFERGEPPIPLILTGEALAEWKRVVPELTRLGVIKRLDMASLTAYCLCWARLVEATRTVAEEGAVIQNDRLGRAQCHPAVRTAEAASKELRGWAGEFGLTPSAEARLGSAAKLDGDDKANPFAAA